MWPSFRVRYPQATLYKTTIPTTAPSRVNAAPKPNIVSMNNSAQPDLETLFSVTDWVQRLPAAAKHRVIADSYDRTYGPREMVGRRGELVTSWIGVVEGLLKVSTATPSGRTVMFTAIPGGSWVGEGSVIKRELRRYDLIALRTTRVIHVPQATFMWLLATSNDFSRYVIDYLNERAGQFIGMLEVARITDPAGRVAGAICNLFHPVLYANAGPLLNISQEEIGELAGLSRSTTNIALKRLHQLELVDTQYGGLLVLNLDRLKTFVNDCWPES